MFNIYAIRDSYILNYFVMTNMYNDYSFKVTMCNCRTFTTFLLC